MGPSPYYPINPDKTVCLLWGLFENCREHLECLNRIHVQHTEAALMDLRRTAERMRCGPEVPQPSNGENTHSEFIAYLLNPAERHDQGDTFLCSFLSLLNLDFDPNSTQKNVMVAPPSQAWLDSDGARRIDIFLRLEGGQIVLIENKIVALKNVTRDEAEQLRKYQDWLDIQPQRAFPHQLVFLTPEGRCPSTVQGVKCLSYSQLADWIECSIRSMQAAPLKEALQQYAGLCRWVSGATD